MQYILYIKRHSYDSGQEIGFVCDDESETSFQLKALIGSHHGNETKGAYDVLLCGKIKSFFVKSSYNITTDHKRSPGNRLKQFCFLIL